MPNDFDRDFLPSLAHFPIEDPRTNDVREHPFTKGGEYLVTASIKLFAQYDLVVPFRVSGCI